MPSNGVSADKMSKETSNISKPVSLVSMYSIVVLGEGLLKLFRPQAIDFGKAFTNEAKKLGVRFLLGTTFYDH